jgi:hypothetical protein
MSTKASENAFGRKVHVVLRSMCLPYAFLFDIVHSAGICESKLTAVRIYVKFEKADNCVQQSCCLIVLEIYNLPLTGL